MGEVVPIRYFTGPALLPFAGTFMDEIWAHKKLYGAKITVID